MLTQQRLKELLLYDPATGQWTWLVTRSGYVAIGHSAGTVRSDGYRRIRIDNMAYYSGQLAWLYITSEWSRFQIDHINRNRSDDRWDNLREATPSDQNANRKLPSNNTSGYRGVSWDSTQGKWDVRVNRQHIGWFEFLDEAIEARDAAALIVQGDFAILNEPVAIGGYIDP